MQEDGSPAMEHWPSSLVVSPRWFSHNLRLRICVCRLTQFHSSIVHSELPPPLHPFKNRPTRPRPSPLSRFRCLTITTSFTVNLWEVLPRTVYISHRVDLTASLPTSLSLSLSSSSWPSLPSVPLLSSSLSRYRYRTCPGDGWPGQG